jgi:hypothetical protein
MRGPRFVSVTPRRCPYVLNDEEAFFGFYSIRQHDVQIRGTAHPMFDLMGKEASLFRYTTRDGSPVSAQTPDDPP